MMSKAAYGVRAVLVCLVALTIGIAGALANDWGNEVVVTAAQGQFVGQGADNFAGDSVATIDLNGDGYTDTVIGAYGYTTSRGRAYIVFGKPAGVSGTVAADAIITGVAAHDRFGSHVVNAGDLNGDGREDLAVNATNADGGTGATYIFFGKANGWTTGLTAANADVKLTGEAFRPTTIASAGDVNGDGLSDLVIGSMNVNNNTGLVAVVLGRTSWPATLSLGAANGVWHGEQAGDLAGFSVAGVGDVNGDGLADLLVGAPNHVVNGLAGAGKAYLIFGSASLPSAGGLASAHVVIAGDQANAALGLRVAAAGDLNGDGIADAAVMEPNRAVGGSFDAGRVSVFLGRTAGWNSIHSVSQADLALNGDMQGARFGSAVAGGADINGDGIDDLVVGGPNHSGTWSIRAGRGKAYVFFGKRAWPTAPTADFSWIGHMHADALGNAIALGDYNNNGTADIVIGARNYDVNSTRNAGAAYFFTSPYERQVNDADGDGIVDELESAAPAPGQTNMYLRDSDGDGLDDGVEDANRNGRRDAGETNARSRDTDGDGIEDGVEVLVLGSNPLDPNDPNIASVQGPQQFDRDKDALPSLVDPNDNNPDVDGDGYADGYEAVMLGLDAVRNSDLKPCLGDVDGDGSTDNLDALIINSVFVGRTGARDVRSISDADITRDGQISNLDALGAQLRFLGLIPTLPLLR